MLRSPSCSRAFALALLFVALSAAQAFAHCFVGPRFLPATLATDDPCVADELSVPTVQWSKTGDVPAATEWDISVELSKRITEDLGISIGETWSQIHQPGGFTQAGFGNLETTIQYQLLKDGPHELARHRRHSIGIGGPVVDANADLLFRQRLRRPARLVRLDPRLRRYRPDRVPDPDAQF
jgi:hypothetical protein